MLFSIIVPIYNTEKYLCRCLDSIISQNIQDFELILIDDGSTDNSPVICDTYASRDARIRVIHKENEGVTRTRNTGIRAAVGEYILYVDSDDWVAPNWLEVIRHFIVDTVPKPDLVYFGVVKVYQDRKILCLPNTAEGIYDRRAIEKKIFPRLISDRRLAFGDGILYPAPVNKAFKRELLREHYCQDERIRINEDNTYSFECTLNAQKIVICKDPLYYYNKENPESILGKKDLTRFRNRLLLFQYLQNRLTSYGPVITRQLNDYYAAAIILDITDMTRKVHDMSEAVRYLRKEMKETGILKFVRLWGLPIHAMAYIALLKMRLYRIALILIKALEGMKNKLRKHRSAGKKQ